MRIVYFGTGSFALPTLEALRESVVLVVTQPDRPKGRGFKLQPSEVKLKALELGLTVESPEKSRSKEFVELLKGSHADFLLVASYGQILSQAVLDSALRGGINLHGSLLPKYRGAAPIQRSILDGEIETGITLMQMDKGMDTGDMIATVKTAINPDETYTELQNRLAVIAADMALGWASKIARGEYSSTPQDSEKATLAAKIEKQEAELSVDRTAVQEYNRFRAFTDRPGAYLASRSGLLRIHRARLGEGRGVPGEILAAKDGLRVAFTEGAIDLLEVQPEGKKRMSGRDYANGARLKAGDRLTF